MSERILLRIIITWCVHACVYPEAIVSSTRCCSRGHQAVPLIQVPDGVAADSGVGNRMIVTCNAHCSLL
eukprot:gene28457-37402_t